MTIRNLGSVKAQPFVAPPYERALNGANASSAKSGGRIDR